MKTKSQSTDPMFIHEYDEMYEHHENQHETSVPEPVEGETFHDWYDKKLRRYAEDTLRLHLLRESYYKTLHYSIHMSSCGSILTDYQLILQCNNLYVHFCHQCRI